MPFRPRELVIRAQEAATLLLNALDREEMVQRFLDMYAAEYRRPGRADQPFLYAEQLLTVRREAILALVTRVEAALPRRLKVHVPLKAAKRSGGKTRKGRRPPRAKKRSGVSRSVGWDFAIPVLDLFREEFFVALGRALEWTQEDADEFWRDLELYESLGARASNRTSSRKAHFLPTGPFVDRVAFLLDPSLMEQARRAAGRFEAELQAAADRVLTRVLSRRRD
ncbi:MAG TPA: hypothetical protein VN661_12780 [Candidatus Acidoferrales bacterium]|nr:hypothetical protein [Candidatus Acidoferrales bacterium]